ncbi:MAG: sugar phosphate isomerase/epimerase [Coprococcus sp.]|nr:sugar phosphate isomerase/epimerase [Coprococcus sp.]
MRNLYIIPDKNKIEESLTISRKYGAYFEYNDFFEPSVLDDKKKKEELIRFYKQLDRDRSMDTLHGAFYDVTIHSSDSKIRKVSELRVRQSMEIAQKLGIRGVIFHTNIIPNFKVKCYMDGWVEQNTRFYKELLHEYPGIFVFMENMFDNEPDVLMQLADNMKDEKYFGVCFDYAHAAISPTPVSEWIRKLAPYIKHMHINDNDLKVDLHQAVGSGKIDYGEYARLLKEYGVETSVLVEIRGVQEQQVSLEYMKEKVIYPFVGEGNG